MSNWPVAYVSFLAQRLSVPATQVTQFPPTVMPPSSTRTITRPSLNALPLRGQVTLANCRDQASLAKKYGNAAVSAATYWIFIDATRGCERSHFNRLIAFLIPCEYRQSGGAQSRPILDEKFIHSAIRGLAGATVDSLRRTRSRGQELCQAQDFLANI